MKYACERIALIFDCYWFVYNLPVTWVPGKAESALAGSQCQAFLAESAKLGTIITKADWTAKNDIKELKQTRTTTA